MNINYKYRYLIEHPITIINIRLTFRKYPNSYEGGCMCLPRVLNLRPWWKGLFQLLILEGFGGTADYLVNLGWGEFAVERGK